MRQASGLGVKTAQKKEEECERESEKKARMSEKSF